MPNRTNAILFGEGLNFSLNSGNLFERSRLLVPRFPLGSTLPYRVLLKVINVLRPYVEGTRQARHSCKEPPS
ncbi:hypothetical protein RRG08_035046 [Elysia crispata]|uniref:Uncharacterized protein n=1 Tax=Elysia crispata TaxID=231223 RepID=A0AAE0ZSQ4_9GAST|nr:hypothetical protein RRG08_035046 [Elysia crispata]